MVRLISSNSAADGAICLKICVLVALLGGFGLVTMHQTRRTSRKARKLNWTMQLLRARDLSRWPVLWWYLLCLACPPSPLGAGESTYSVLPVCHATGTAFMQLNSLFSCDTARIVWTLPLIVGGTQPCHFLCCAILILPVLVVDHSFGLLQCQEAVTFCLDITPVCWWHTALPFFVPCQAAVHQILLLGDK